MVQVIRMPMMGNTMETGTLIEWAYSEGEQIGATDLVAIVESEKASAEIVAEQDGILARVDVTEGEEVPPGTVLGILAGADESIEDAPAPRSRTGADESESAEPEREPADPDPDRAERGETVAAPTETDTADDAVRAAPGARRLASESGITLADVEATGPDGAILRHDVEAHIETTEAIAQTEADETTDEQTGRVFASPTTRRLAREHGVSLADISGTGSDGKVTESDVRIAIGREPPAATSEPTDAAATRPATAQPEGVTVVDEYDLSGARKTVATRMATSAREAPHVTLDREVDVTRAVETAEELTAIGFEAVGFNDLLIAAVSQALAEHPTFNAWFDDGTHRLISEVNVAVAVDADIGLVTPVIRDADRRTVEGIADERRRLTETVLEGTHSMADLQGGTFTITNLGMFGIDSFTPVINPPQIAILGVGRIDDGACTLSLSFDHRPVDGADAARFLATIADGLEAPSGLIARHRRTSADEQATAESDTDGRQSASESSRQTQRAKDTAPEDAERGHETVAAAISAEIEAQAGAVAEYHGWPLPSLEVVLSDDRPTITVDRPEGLSAATARRLVYAACRESQYARSIPKLHDLKLIVG